MKVLELVERLRARRDDRRAQEELYLLVSAALLPRIRARIPRTLFSRTDAEDVLHRAFLRSLLKIESFNAAGEDSYKAWVYSIAKNMIADLLRRRSVQVLRFAQGEDGKGPRESQIVFRGRSPETQLAREDWIDSILAQLTKQEAEVIRLRALKDMSFADIASLWRKTPGAVQRFYSRAWQRFHALAKQRSTRVD